MGVTIRYKNLKDRRQSIYLDIFKAPDRKYEFFKDYFRYTNPSTDEEKEFNKRVNEEVKKIAAQRRVELLNDKIKFLKIDKSDNDFLKHFKKESDARFAKRGCKSNTYCCYKKIVEYTGGSLLLNNLTEEFCEEFKTFLITKLSDNCARTYFLRFKMVVAKVHKMGLIKANPTLEVENIKEVQNYREFLTGDELNILKATPARVVLIKKMFITGCFTGLRISDLKAIKWKHVKGRALVFYPVKTPNKLHIIPLNQNALDYMGEPGEPEDFIFPWPYEGDGNRYDLLREWIWKDCGILRNITWHTARHTFATLMLLKTKNLKAVQEGLGHSRSSTTEIYAHLLNLTLIEAVNSLDTI